MAMRDGMGFGRDESDSAGPMTGDDIRDRVFPRRIRGYDPAQVDTWLAYVADVLDAGPSALDAGCWRTRLW
jgi:DivIVA domain-containing protein